MSAAALTDLATVKLALGITGTGDDALLNALITSVSAAAAVYCNRNFGVNNYTETYDGEYMPTLWLNQRPVVSVTNVQVDGIAVTQRTAGQPTSYGWANDQNKLFFNGGVFNEGFQNVVVTYTAGITVSPAATPDLWRAVAEWVGFVYKSQQHLDKSSDTGLEGQGTTYLKTLPLTVTLVLDRYKQVATTQTLSI